MVRWNMLTGMDRLRLQSSYSVSYYDSDSPLEASFTSPVDYASEAPSEASTHASLEVGLGGDSYNSSIKSSDKCSNESSNNESESDDIVTRSQRERPRELDEETELHREAAAHL
jgi:hypothetical protein